MKLKKRKTQKASVATCDARWIEMMESEKEKEDKELEQRQRKALQDEKKI